MTHLIVVKAEKMEAATLNLSVENAANARVYSYRDLELRAKGNTKTTSFLTVAWHAPEAELGNANQPGETVEVVDGWWQGNSYERQDTPQANLSLDLFLIWFDNEALRPGRSIPLVRFLLFG